MKSRLFLRYAPFAAALLLLTGCPAEQEETNQANADAGNDVLEDDTDNNNNEPLPQTRSTDCDPLMPDYCSMPWPSNQYLAEDSARTTGYFLDFGDETLPVSDRSSSAVDPTPYRRLDGYGWGTPVVALFPDVDISNMPQELSIEDSLEDDERQALYYEVTDDGLEPVPFWAELDVHAESPEEQVLYLRPGVILEPDTRYVVAFRNLVDQDGQAFERSPAFEAYLSGDAADDPELAWRQERFDDIFSLLEDAGVDRDELTLAWDFHTSSTDAMHHDLLSIVDQGLDAADAEGIDLTITNLEAYSNDDPDAGDYHARIAYDIEGTFRVPHFMVESDRSGMTAFLINRDDDDEPVQNGWREAEFWMQIPWSAVDGTPHGLVKYGHGMLGEGSQVRGSFNQEMANNHDLIFYGASFVGFSSEDVPQAVLALSDGTHFEEIADRMHQGVLEYILLTQGMLEGLEDLPADPAFDDFDQTPDLSVDADRVYYSGISQGGIYGVPVLALDPNITRGHFGVGGHNYAMLMERSSNFFGEDGGTGYYFPLSQGYPERVDQSMIIPVLQLLWDKVDPISFQRHLSADPIDPDHPKEGLFAIAKADHQVAVVTNEIMARSGINIPILEPYDRERGMPWNVDTATYPREGSGVVLYDFGNPWPATGNAPPEDDLGDPHGRPRRLDEHTQQLVEFLDTGVITDVCGGEACYFPVDE